MSPAFIFLVELTFYNYMHKYIQFLHPALLLPQLLHKQSPPIPREEAAGDGGAGEGERGEGEDGRGGGSGTKPVSSTEPWHKIQQSADDGGGSQLGREDRAGN